MVARLHVDIFSGFKRQSDAGNPLMDAPSFQLMTQGRRKEAVASSQGLFAKELEVIMLITGLVMPGPGDKMPPFWLHLVELE